MDIRKEYKELAANPLARRIVFALSALIAAALIFHAGMVVGARRGGPNGSAGGGFFFTPFGALGIPHGFIEDNHGAVGQVTSVSLPEITIRERNGTEKTVLVDDNTVIDSPSDDDSGIATSSFVVIIGSPDDSGRITARIIRVLPMPPADKARPSTQPSVPQSASSTQPQPQAVTR